MIKDNSQIMLKNFKKKYGYIVKLVDGNPKIDFTKIKFRPGAGFTTPFHIDNTFDKLRIHNAIDRASGSIYCPFDCYAEYINPYNDVIGSLFIMKPIGTDFSIRIFHIEKLSDDVQQLVDNKQIIKSGKYLAEAGNLGKSLGNHTHTEIVSNNEKSAMLETLLLEAYNVVGQKGMNEFQIKQLITSWNDPRMTWEDYVEERKWRGVIKANNYALVRKDYHTGKTKTFYNSQKIFNM